MNCNNLISKILIGLGLIALTSCAKSQALQTGARFSSDTWPEQCRVLKQDLSTQSSINITFQPHPDKIAINTSWKLNWFGRQVPIPAIDYSDVRISHGNDGYSLILMGNSKTVTIVLSRQPNIEPMADIFAEFSEAETASVQDSPEGIALTEKLFGGPVSIGKLADLGYRHNLDDLTCTRAHWEQEVPIAIALILKGVASPAGQTASAYELNSGVLTRSQGESQEKWWSQWDDGKYYSDMYIRLPKDNPHGDLGFVIGQTDWQAAKGAPLWLTHVETAIANPSRKNWQTLQTALKEAKMSPESVQNIQKLIDESSD